ncbi:glycoside hydrolase [Niastella koreensis]|uniref:Glycoside hydrolase family 28 n=2 Tax=Niastella koreensis TaxID=354356 RepID=G8TEU8_NIAKG|nr:glycoside hydrolase family 28 protein [Niastella koreensis]AEW01536.1 glycoside hydrolase family 28 [Niastella koreensis GR20-10]OQP48256.1 glycoside hydrolase [Niastella koreensis]
MNNWFKAAAVLGLMACSSGLSAQKLPVIQPTSFKKDSTWITKYGAVADGQMLNTQAINAAIDACNKKGGGVVVVPAGLWATGPITLKSNVNLHLKKGAVLQFTKDFNQYQLVEGNWEGIPQMRNQSPVSATNATNIAITGFGVIDGGGEAWRQVRKEKLTESQWKEWVAGGGVVSEDGKSWYPSEQWLKAAKMKNPGEFTPDKTPEFYKSIKDFLRPNLIVLTKCKKVLLEGVTFQNSAAWCLHPLMSEDLTVRNVTVKNPWFAQNGDGIDVESCNRVLIENSSFDVGDDGLCMKSGRDEAGRKRGMPTENVIIRDCKVYHAHGGFVIGSEMSGGARNIWVNNCTFIGTDIGLRFKTTRGRGGIVENIYCNDIQMIDIPGEAILFDMYYMSVDPVALAGEKRELPKVEKLPVDEGTPQFRNFVVKNVVCNGAAKGIFLRGIPEMHVKDVLLENCILQARKGIDCQEASGITFKNITILSKETNPVVDIINSDHLTFDKLTYKKDADLLFRVAGDRTKNISIQNTDASKAKDKIQYEFGATAQDVTIK